MQVLRMTATITSPVFGKCAMVDAVSDDCQYVLRRISFVAFRRPRVMGAVQLEVIYIDRSWRRIGCAAKVAAAKREWIPNLFKIF